MMDDSWIQVLKPLDNNIVHLPFMLKMSFENSSAQKVSAHFLLLLCLCTK